MRHPSVETLRLTRIFRGSAGSTIRALDSVDLRIHEGEIFGLLGPNGAGKTTLIKILTTLLLPTQGEAYVGGMNVVEKPAEVRRLINLVSGGETPGYGILSVRENLWFFSQLYGLPSAAAKHRIRELIEELELQQYEGTRMNKLSTGFKQRLNLARGFINDPTVLFLDEPTLGLDVLSAKHLRAFIAKWVRESNHKTVLLTTHYMAEADEMCDRVAIIDRGRILACDAPNALKSRLAMTPTIKLDVMSKAHGFDRLKTVPGVLGVSESHSIQTGLTTLKIVVQAEAAIPAVMSTVTTDGSKVIAMSKMEPTLEDVYISLVGKGFEESEASHVP